MRKEYKARTEIAISIVLPNGKNKHVRFSPLSNGSSVYYSEDEEEQKGLESHYKFGKVFTAKEYVEPKPVVKQPVKPIVNDGYTTITVADLMEAKDILSDKYGVSRTKMRSRKQIEEAAEANKVKFEGI